MEYSTAPRALIHNKQTDSQTQHSTIAGYSDIQLSTCNKLLLIMIDALPAGWLAASKPVTVQSFSVIF